MDTQKKILGKVSMAAKANVFTNVSLYLKIILISEGTIDKKRFSESYLRYIIRLPTIGKSEEVLLQTIRHGFR